MKKKIRFSIRILVVRIFPAGLILLSQTLLSQGGHYWTEQYGTRSILMSGSVIGGVEDLGAIYYNPGRLALIENAAFLLSANLYQLSKLRITDAVDEGKDLENSSFGGVPGLAAGTFKLGFLPKHHFAYAVLTRQRSNNNFFVRTEKEGDVLPKLPGEELFTGRLILNSSFVDEWMSLTWSYALKENFSIGVTNVYTTTSSSKSIEMPLQALYDNSSKVAQLSRNRLINFQHNGLLWKFGLAWKTDWANLGLTVTTPKINLKGSGTFLFEDFLSGLPDSSANNNIFESSIQGNLPVLHKTPLSVGAGATFSVFGKHFLHLSGEWYQSIPVYPIVSANPFIGQSSGREINFSLYDQAEHLINFGAGLEITVSEPVSLYTSFSTDFSYVQSDLVRFIEFADQAMNSTFRADIYHLGGGFVLKLKRADITLGTTYAWAKESFPRPVDFPDEGQDAIFNSDDTAEMYWSRWRFIFSFSVPFLKDVEKKFEEKFENWGEDKKDSKEEKEKEKEK